MIGMSGVTKQFGFAGHAMGLGMNIGFEKLGGSSTKDAVVNGALWYAAETYVKGAMLLPMVADIAQASYGAYSEHKKYGQSKLQKNYKGGFGGNFQDTQQAYTMRQRGVQALQQSKMNARSVLGSEARAYHI